MPTQLWQINPALSIYDDPINQSIQIGQLAPHAYEIHENYNELKNICLHLMEHVVFSKAQFIELANNFQMPSEDLFFDFRKLKLVIPKIQESERYSRHRLYYEFAGVEDEPQRILSQKSVILIGAGGIGSTCATLLASAGIGRIILADGDVVEESNLTRTTLFQMDDLGIKKSVAARVQILARNPGVRVDPVLELLCESTFDQYFDICQTVDFIILSGDSDPDVHRLSYEISERLCIPIINSGYVESNGVVGPITIGKNSRREKEQQNSFNGIQLNPNLMAPSYGPLNSLVSSMTVNEVIRYFLGLAPESLNTRIVIDSYTYQIFKEPWS